MYFYSVNDNIYVLKEIRYMDRSVMESAMQEKELMSSVRHKNVCKYIDSFD